MRINLLQGRMGRRVWGSFLCGSASQTCQAAASLLHMGLVLGTFPSLEISPALANSCSSSLSLFRAPFRPLHSPPSPAPNKSPTDHPSLLDFSAEIQHPFLG
jgi:hypothetical protein